MPCRFAALGLAVACASCSLHASAHVANSSAAPGVAIPEVSKCIQTLLEMVVQKSPELMPYVLATGKQLPNDAGKYAACVGLPSSRYFLLSLVAQGKVPGQGVHIPVTLGLCLPGSCSHEDVKVMASNPNMLTAMVSPAINAYALVNISSSSPDLDVQRMDLGFAMAVAVVSLLALLVAVSTLLVFFRSPPQGFNVRTASRRSHSVDSVPPSPAVYQAERGLHSPSPSRDPSEPEVTQALSARQLLLAGAETPPSCAQTPPSRSGREDTISSCPTGRHEWPLVVRAFSLVGPTGSLPKLLEKTSPKPTDALNGMRVLSMMWIILGHTFLMPTGISGYMNYEDVVDSAINTHAAEDNPLLMLVIAAEQGVDTFFFLSGFLLAHLTLKELVAKGGKFNRCQAVLGRYLRLTPSLAVAMLVYYKIVAFLGDGPFAPMLQQSITSRCDSSWWSELTYTMNFIPFDSNKVCMGWTWYLGDDMIFFIIGILIMPVFYRRKWLGWGLLLALLTASAAVTTWLISHYDLSPYAFGKHYTDYSYWAYSKPYTRIGAYLVGVAAAWILADLEKRGVARATLLVGPRRSVVVFSFVLAVLMLCFLIFVPTTDFGQHKDSWNSIESNLFLNFGRWVWAMCFAVVTIACYYDCIPRTNSFLSHYFWVPPMRLTYGAYLCHPLVIKLAAGNESQFYHFSAQDLLYRTVGNIVCAYAASVVLWCLVERPTMTISTVLLRKGGGRAGSSEGVRGVGMPKSNPADGKEAGAEEGMRG